MDCTNVSSWCLLVTVKVLVDIGLTVRVMFCACVLTGDLRKLRLLYLVLYKI